MTSWGFAGRGFMPAGWHWPTVRVMFHVAWLALVAAVVLISAGLALGGAVGYGLTKLVEAAVGSLEL